MHRFLVGIATSLLAMSSAVWAAPVDVNSYPELNDKQLGTINRIVALSRQADGDWSAMGGEDPDQVGYDSYRYQLAFMSYTLSLAKVMS